ncbi:gamma-glutamyltransferase [Cohnella herbarum]|uniref:Glutathione hydrolase proenzyme n=1 Tax=Cohnella herbarum TaxID=2728023 RepID=A0A7Z2VP87_9BACL|nr:gamma-glutamyltransferase [Cohnella herbarum]QJD86653.1 gamma-glutamyltransferase [Cohnella herbarum]
MNNATPITRHVMVTSPHYLASMVGARILGTGGNAFDAAVAVSAALGVVYPHMTGMGGDAFFMLYRAESKQLIGFNGTGRAGSRADIPYFANRGLTSIPLRGILSAVTVPGMVDAWWEVWSGNGKLTWEQILEPAVEYAEKGFPISRNLREWICRDERLIRSCPAMAGTFLPGGKTPHLGDVLTQPDLAESLRLLQREGRDSFYRGGLMKRMIAEMDRAGGLLTESDFSSHTGQWVKPISTDYRGYRVYQMPPNSQGFTTIMMMNMLEQFDLKEIPRQSADYYHLMTEVVKRAFRDRDLYLTDPEFADIPLDRLLSKFYAERLAEEISLERAEERLSSAMGQDTAYAAVVDGEGNSVSFIQSLYFDFGSCYMPEGTGVIMQNRGSFFSLDAEHVNGLQPGKRTFHTLMPAMVFKDEAPYLLLGTQGGEGQPQTQLSILTSVLDYGDTIQEAIANPRWVYGRTWGQNSDTLKVEGRIPASEIELLRGKGHLVERVGDWDGLMGQAQGILIDREKGCLHGAADPRGDGMALGW